jgi:hypothetical protein
VPHERLRDGREDGYYRGSTFVPRFTVSMTWPGIPVRHATRNLW